MPINEYRSRLDFQRRLIQKVLADLEGADLVEETRGFQRGWAAAAAHVRELLAPELPGSQKQATLTQAANMLGLTEGLGTGHIEKVWEVAYAEGQRSPSLRLALRFLRGLGI